MRPQAAKRPAKRSNRRPNTAVIPGGWFANSGAHAMAIASAKPIASRLLMAS
jgi:hypothetical protein